jgi:Ca2+-binding RTX toxin-like protein
MKSSSAGYNAGYDVYLTSTSVGVIYASSGQPGTDWTHFSVNLDDTTAWHFGSAGGALATAAQIQAILTNLTAVTIRAEYENGAENGSLDNVAMVAPGGKALCWNVFDNASDVTPSVFGNLGDALAASADGNVLVLDDIGNIKVKFGTLSVHDNALTIHAGPANGTLLFDAGVTSLTLEGKTNADVTGNSLNNVITGSDGDNTLSGGDGNDQLTGGRGDDTMVGGAGADKMDGGGGHDMFMFSGLSDSTGATYDTIIGFNAAQDTISPNAAVTGVDTAITTGLLGDKHFDNNLTAAVGASKLGAHHAVLFTADSGNLAGKTFLVIDTNGTAGYQHGDIVVLLSHSDSTAITTDNFVMGA